MILGFKELIEKISGGEEYKSSFVSGDYTELKFGDEIAETPAVERAVKVCKMKGFADVDTTAQELADGNIVILDIKPLAERSMNELKHAVEEMKSVCLSMGGDIAGISEYHLIMTPPTVKIERAGGKRDEFERTMERVQSRVQR